MSYSASVLSDAFALIGRTPIADRPALLAEANRVLALAVCSVDQRAQARAIIVAYGLRSVGG